MSETIESGTIESDPRRYAEVASDPSASDIRKKTWPHGMPALRLSRTPRRPHHAPAPSSGGTAGLHAHPRLLRATRLVVGLVLLVFAWGAVLADVALAHALLHPGRGTRGFGRFADVALQVAAAGWIGIMALACIVAGAFFLTLALTNRAR